MINFETTIEYNATIKLSLIILILICIYFFKSHIFLYLKKIISYISNYRFKLLKFFSFNSFQFKTNFLKLVTLGILVWFIFTNKVNFIINHIFDIDFFFYFILFNILLCFYIGYRNVEIKKETFLFLQFEIPYFLAPFYLFSEGFFYMGFFLMYPFYKLSDFFFTCLFKYLENLYYNLSPKVNLLLTFSVWIMLSFLDESNKFQVIYDKYSNNGLLLVFLFLLIIYIYLRKNERFSFLLNAYLFCINVYIAFCVFIIVLIEKTVIEKPYKIISEYVLFKHITLSKEVFFFVCFLIVIFFFKNKLLFFNNNKNKKEILQIKAKTIFDFFVKNLGYFFFNGIAIGRVLAGGIIKNATDGVVDSATLEVIETAKETPVPLKGLTKKDMPETSHELMKWVADNVIEIRKNKELKKAVQIAYQYHRSINRGFGLYMNPSYLEGESCSRHLFDWIRKCIVNYKYPPIYMPDYIKRGADNWMPGTNKFEQQKLVDLLTVSKIEKDYFKYKDFTRAGAFNLVIYFDRVDKKEVLDYMKKHPERVCQTRFVDYTKTLARNSQDIKFVEDWACKNETRLLQMQTYQTGRLVHLMQNAIRKFPKL